MIRRFLCTVAVLLLATAVRAQGSDTPSTGAQSRGQQSGTVQAGAGSKGDVTPGTSGPQGSAGETIEPAPAAFDVRPPVDAFYGPRSLPIVIPKARRCELIGHPATRQKCEQATTVSGGKTGG